MTLITALISTEKWDEDRSITTTPRVTPAHALFTAPKIDATIQTEFLMTYLPDGNAEFIFTDVVNTKNFQGRRGSFIAHGKGTFVAKTFTIKATFDIVEGSGTGELSEISGKGKIATAIEDPEKVTYEFVVEGI
jgi:hypothetical protein